MSVASIVCVDGELDVHDTASRAVAAAIERRREQPDARIGICVGDIELGDPLGLAKRLCELAEPGAILVSDAIRRVAERDGRRFVDLGAVSIAGYLDRVQVFELDGTTEREWTVLNVELMPHGRMGERGKEAEERAQYDAELVHHDRVVWSTALAHRGLVTHARVLEHELRFAHARDALTAAIALDTKLLEQHTGTLSMGVERGRLTYMAHHWLGTALQTARGIRTSRYRQVATTMTVVEHLGAASLRGLGLVIEEVQELVQRGVRDPVRVAHLRIELPYHGT